MYTVITEEFYIAFSSIKSCNPVLVYVLIWVLNYWKYLICIFPVKVKVRKADSHIQIVPNTLQCVSELSYVFKFKTQFSRHTSPASLATYGWGLLCGPAQITSSSSVYLSSASPFISTHPQPSVPSSPSMLGSWEGGFEVLWSSHPLLYEQGPREEVTCSVRFVCSPLSALPGTAGLLLRSERVQYVSAWVFHAEWGIPSSLPANVAVAETPGEARLYCSCVVAEAAGSLGPAGSAALRSSHRAGWTISSRDDGGQTEHGHGQARGQHSRMWRCYPTGCGKDHQSFSVV